MESKYLSDDRHFEECRMQLMMLRKFAFNGERRMCISQVEEVCST